MLDVYPLPININFLGKISSNSNINVGYVHHDIAECKSGNSVI